MPLIYYTDDKILNLTEIKITLQLDLPDQKTPYPVISLCYSPGMLNGSITWYLCVSV